MTVLIELKSIGKKFLTDEIETRAINDINLVINKGEYLSLSGQSGCVKSTLLALLGLLDAPSSGTYKINNTDASSLTRDERAKIRSRQIGFYFNRLI
jgi:putative ABC transport system ATP-binding protein